MSVDNLKEYARRCAMEPELRATARELGAMDVAGHIRHAEGLGLGWSGDDMIAFRKELIDSEGDFEALTEEELEQVAGGAVTVTAAAAVAAVAIAGTAVAVTAGWGGATAAGGGGW